MKKCKDHLGNEYDSITKMCNHYDIRINTFNNRINRGYTLEEALTDKKRNFKVKDPFGNDFDSLTKMCEHYKTDLSKYLERISKGYSIYEALGIIPLLNYRVNNVKLCDNLVVISPIKSSQYDTIALNCEYNNSFVILTKDEIIKIYEEEMGFIPKS